jgi:hypothetical protein
MKRYIKELKEGRQDEETTDLDVDYRGCTDGNIHLVTHLHNNNQVLCSVLESGWEEDSVFYGEEGVKDVSLQDRGGYG